MSRIVSRWRMIVVVFAGILSLAGCQTEDKGGPSAQDLTYMRIQPDYNLEALPPGYAYELWVFNIEILDDTIIRPGEFRSLARFVWDPALYLARDPEDTNVILPLTSLTGVNVDVDITKYQFAFLTIEPVPDPVPEFPSGPALLVSQLDRRNPGQVSFIVPHSFPPQVGGVAPVNQLYTFVSQSNKKGLFRPSWRDGREGQGIWFCLPQVRDLEVVDPVVSYRTYFQNFVTQRDTFAYSIWINNAFPDSSFSNFGLVYRNQEPDLRIRNGVPLHDSGKTGPQAPLGQDRLIIAGDTIYRYFSADGRDTCLLNVTNPDRTRCTRDTFQVLLFDDTVNTKRVFLTADGDTLITPTLGGIGDRDNPFSGGLLQTWDYEAWLIFDKSSGIPPLSLGRFSRPFGRDRSNRFTDPAGYDRNFNVPGEDFLVNLESHHPDLHGPLDVIRDPRVKKIWVTIEPRQDDSVKFDWAPDKPYTQLILYSAWIPKAPIPRIVGDENTFQIVYRDRSPGEESLNENHYWPTMVVYFQPPPQ